MIIDLILDRKDDEKNGYTNYVAHDFYSNILEYENIFNFKHDISLAMDYGTNEDVQKALCNYIDDNEYNPDIKYYINSVKWID